MQRVSTIPERVACIHLLVMLAGADIKERTMRRVAQRGHGWCGLWLICAMDGEVFNASQRPNDVEARRQVVKKQKHPPGAAVRYLPK